MNLLLVCVGKLPKPSIFPPVWPAEPMPKTKGCIRISKNMIGTTHAHI